VPDQSILIVGSVAYDSIKTPYGSRLHTLGGSATYSSIAASYFSSVNLVAVVGADFRDESTFQSHEIGMKCLTKASGETFQWVGEYRDNFSETLTIDTKLNVLSNFKPLLGSEEKNSEYLFLGNIDPELQKDVLNQMNQRPKLVVGDTMNYWIESKPKPLYEVIGLLDALLINESEVKLLAKEANLVKASRLILEKGPSILVIKRGGAGLIGFTSNDTFAIPAYPIDKVMDPTGAGDTFAGGFLGYLSAIGTLSKESLRHAMVIGSVMASFAVETFGLDRLDSLTDRDIRERYQNFREMTAFDTKAELRVPSRKQLSKK
jgi:sugar/nucleoside kinase (ribokinase family)